MKHRYSEGMFFPMCESFLGEDDNSSVLYQKVNRNTDKQKFYFTFI